MSIPAGFAAKVRGWLGGDAALERRVRRGQRLLHVYNRHTKSTTAFNPLRSKRPLPKAEKDPREFIREALDKSAYVERC